jgi:hypothetical protein
MLHAKREAPYESEDGIREESRGHRDPHSVLAAADVDPSPPVRGERKADGDRITESVGSSSGLVLLLVDVRLASAHDLDPLSPVRGEL